MKRTNSLSDLFMEELSGLLNAENQLAEALPKLARASRSSALKRILEEHLKVIKEQAFRLQGIFSNIGQNPQRVAGGTKNFIQEGEELINKAENGLAHDTDIISIAQRVERYKIERYATACEHAGKLGHTKIVELLDMTLNEEREINLVLNELVQDMINIQATNPKGARQPKIFSHKKNKKGFIPKG